MHQTINWTTPQLRTHIQNFSKIEQSAAVLLQFRCVQFGRRRPSWIWLGVDFNTSAACDDPYCTCVSNVSTAVQSAAELLMIQPSLLAPLSGRGNFVPPSSQSGSDLSHIWDGDRPIIDASNAPSRLQISCFISNQRASKVDWDRKLRPNFALPPC